MEECHGADGAQWVIDREEREREGRKRKTNSTNIIRREGYLGVRVRRQLEGPALRANPEEEGSNAGNGNLHVQQLMAMRTGGFGQAQAVSEGMRTRTVGNKWKKGMMRRDTLWLYGRKLGSGNTAWVEGHTCSQRTVRRERQRDSAAVDADGSKSMGTAAAVSTYDLHSIIRSAWADDEACTRRLPLGRRRTPCTRVPINPSTPDLSRAASTSLLSWAGERLASTPDLVFIRVPMVTSKCRGPGSLGGLMGAAGGAASRDIALSTEQESDTGTEVGAGASSGSGRRSGTAGWRVADSRTMRDSMWETKVKSSFLQSGTNCEVEKDPMTSMSLWMPSRAVFTWGGGGTKGLPGG
ncbi:hypothetical protein BD413DRAFT_494940 [Trametes elegans]|nr:hypothetical protein BD413DRAFT_494940 [Trametes elegans]